MLTIRSAPKDLIFFSKVRGGGGESMGLSFIWRQASARKFICNLFSYLSVAHLRSGRKGL